MQSLVSVVLASIGAAAPQPELSPRLAAALALVPADAAAFVAIPSPKLLSDDLGECIARMDRPETAITGRPIDQVKALLGVSANFDDSGPLVIVQARRGDDLAPLAILPSTDPPAFAAANFTAVPESGDDAWRTRDGSVVFVKPLARHVAIGPDAETVRGFVQPADGGIVARVRERLGPRGIELALRGDAIAWGGSSALAATLAAMEASTEAALVDAPAASLPFNAIAARDAQRRIAELLRGVSDGLVVIDVDPLGVSLRTFARFDASSELAQLAAGGPARSTRFDRVPKAPFYLALRADVSGLGGVAAVERLLALLPGGATLPPWIAEQREHLHALQFIVSPSRMGIATGGLLNEATLFLASDRPEELRRGIRSALEASAGSADGVARSVSVEIDKSLRSGETADAFEIQETVLPDVPAERVVELGIRRAVAQAIFGSRGFVGFIKPVAKGAIMTFSQRTDVLGRAIEASSGRGTLGEDATLSSYADWLIEDADIEGFVGVGHFGKLLQQLASIVPGGEGIPLPQIPTSVEPIAFALDLRDGAAESALVVPTGVLALVYDQIRGQARERLLGAGEAR
jgi:hypothetical protein